MRTEPNPQPARDRFWLVIAIIVLWLACSAGLLIGAAEIYQRSLKLWWPT
ncbi:hypothetical protein [Kaistia sp. MMO-174]